MAFFLEATFVGLMFFGWERLSRQGHLFVPSWSPWAQILRTLDSGGQRLDAEPVGAAFNPDTMRMEVTNFGAVLFNPVAQAKFVHTSSAGYVLASSSCSASRRSCFERKWPRVAKRSFAVAASSSGGFALGRRSAMRAATHSPTTRR